MVIEYPSGQEPNLWHPDPSDPRHRFALGRVGDSSVGAQPLVVIGMNPSHARERESDRTVNRIIEAAERHGYSGWVMLNLYPERSPKPSALSEYDAALSAANCATVEMALLEYRVTEVLGAWGNVPHRTLKRARRDVQALLARMGVRLFTFDPLTKLGNPRHPHPPGRPLPMLGPKRYLT